MRGATTASEDSPTAILEATRELLETLRAENDIQPEDIASIFFTTSHDLSSAFPAAAARELGWHRVPLLCSTEIPVPGGVQRCIRVLIHINTTRGQEEIRHVYLREASRLRLDLAEG